MLWSENSDASMGKFFLMKQYSIGCNKLWIWECQTVVKNTRVLNEHHNDMKIVGYHKIFNSATTRAALGSGNRVLIKPSRRMEVLTRVVSRHAYVEKSLLRLTRVGFGTLGARKHFEVA